MPIPFQIWDESWANLKRPYGAFRSLEWLRTIATRKQHDRDLDPQTLAHLRKLDEVAAYEVLLIFCKSQIVEAV